MSAHFEFTHHVEHRLISFMSVCGLCLWFKNCFMGYNCIIGMRYIYIHSAE